MESANRPLRRSRAANTAFRRQQLIDATIESVSQVGLADTTLAKVASLAGLSQGIVVFRFGTKEQLLVEALKFLSDEYKQAWTSALEACGPAPVERLCALIAADFQPKVISKKKLAVWHAFYGEAKAHPIYQDICEARDEEHTAALHRILTEVAALGPHRNGIDPDQATELIDSLSDGLWLQMLMSKSGFDRNSALDLMFLQLESLLPDHVGHIRRYRQEGMKPVAKAGKKAAVKPVIKPKHSPARRG